MNPQIKGILFKMLFRSLVPGLVAVGFAYLTHFAPSAQAQRPCCQITVINEQAGIVTAKVNATGQTFEFSVTNQALLHSLKIGQGIYANFKTNQVSADGISPCCQIVSTGGVKAAPALPTTGAAGPPINQMSASQARPAPCCEISAINQQTAVVTAKVNSTGQSFEFTVPTQALLQSLQVGQGIYANFKTQQVSLDGLKPCCQIISVGTAQPGSGAIHGGASPQGQKLVGSVFRGGPCCSVTTVGTSNGVATAKINFSGQTFQFKAANQPSLPALKLGQGVYANFQTAQVSVDGVQWCCQILAVGPRTPRVPPRFRPGPAVRLGSPLLTPRPAKTGPTVSTQLRPQAPGQVSPFMQASGGSGVDAANELISLPWPGLSQTFVQQQVVKQLNDSLGSGVPIASGSGSIGIDVSCCGGLGLGSAQVGADWKFDLKLQQQAAPYIDLSSGAPGFRYASLTGEGGNPPGFIARAPLNGGWNFGTVVSLVLDASIDDHVGQSLDWSVPTLTLTVGVLNFSATAAAQLDTSDPSRPKLVKADLSPDLILFMALGVGGTSAAPIGYIPIPISFTLESQTGNVAIKGSFASNAIPGLPLNTRATGDITLTLAPNKARGIVTATLGLTGYLEIDLINPVNHQNLATQKLDLASLSLPFDLPGDIQGSLAGSNFDFPLLKLIAPAAGPLPITWPPAAVSVTNTPVGNWRPGPGSSGKNGNAVSYDLELGGVTPPPPNPLPDFAGVAQQLEAAMPRHIPYGAILMLDKTDQLSTQFGGPLGVPRLSLGSKLPPFTYGRLADSAIWTGHYLAAESFRYAATKDPAALTRVQEVLAGIQVLFDNTRDAVGQNCVSIGGQRTCDYKPVRAQAAGNILSRSVLPSNSSFPYTLDHTLQGYPPDMPARSDGKTPCFYIHPDGGWAVGNRVYQTLAAAPLPQEPSQGKTVGAPTGNQLPQAVLNNPNQTVPTGQFQQSVLLLKPRPLGTLWYGVGCGKDGEDDVVSRDQYVGTMMGLAFAYALVPPVQNQVRQMVDKALSYIVQNNWNIPAPPDQVVFTSLIGDFDMQLDYLRIGATVDQPKWGPIYQHYQSASALAWLSVWPDTLDPMNSYFGFNLSHATYSPYLFLEQSDSAMRQNLLAAYNIMRGATATHKDPYYDLVRILIEPPGNRGAIASSPAPSNPNISLSDEIISLLSEWVVRWNLVRANVVQKTDSPFPTNAIPNPQDIEWLWVQPQHVAVYTGLDGSCQILSTFALPLESRPGDRDYLWENPPFDTGVSCTGPSVGLPPAQAQIASSPYREGAAIDYLLPYWMAVYLGLLK